MRVPLAVWGLVKEVARHLLRRPVVGIVAVAQTVDGRVLLIRRGDTGEWAPPGGTLEWGETLQSALVRELREEAGASLLAPATLVGVYSSPHRDARFHAVTVVVKATVAEPTFAVLNPLEVLEVRLFDQADLPSPLAHGLDDAVRNALSETLRWE